MQEESPAQRGRVDTFVIARLLLDDLFQIVTNESGYDAGKPDALT